MKHAFYLLCTMILCFLVGLLVVLLVTIALSSNVPMSCAEAMSALCLLPSRALWIIMGFSIVSGYFLGQTWWRIVYIEKRHFGWFKKRP